MKISRMAWKVGSFAVLAIGTAAAQGEEPALSSAEIAIVNRQIATLKNPGERKMAQEWTTAKKVGEFICRPAALARLKKQFEGADRVFLGTDAPNSLTLVNNGQLTGSGQVRAPQGWQYFTFTCDVNPESGKVVAFHTVPAEKASPPQ